MIHFGFKETTFKLKGKSDYEKCEGELKNLLKKCTGNSCFPVINRKFLVIFIIFFLKN